MLRELLVADAPDGVELGKIHGRLSGDVIKDLVREDPIGGLPEAAGGGLAPFL